MTRSQFIRARLLAPPPSGLGALVWVILCTAVPTLVRQGLDQAIRDITFVTYYPIVMVTALLLGPRVALGTAALSTVVANFLFMEPRYEFFADADDVVGAMLFLATSTLFIVTASTLRREVQESHEASEREVTLNRELQHRVRNTLTVVQGLATTTFQGSSEPDTAVRVFRSRLHALADAHDILTGGKWETCQFPELAHRALAPFAGEGLISFEGPDCQLPEASCVPLVLALHELGANAVKYGALSKINGCVDLTWNLSDDDGGQMLLLRWVESGGPAVEPPKRRGLGSKLLAPQRGIRNVSLDFRPSGLVCEIAIAGAHARTVR